MRFLATVMCLLAAGPGLATASESAPVPDKITEGWYLGLPVVLEVQFPRVVAVQANPPKPTQIPPVYLIAPVDESVAFTPDMMIETPAGQRLLPAHQDVLSICASDVPGMDSEGFFVLVGAQGSAETVRVKELADPTASVSGGALATTLRVGKTWVPLTSHIIIEYGVANGRLRLVPFILGGRVRARGRDGALAPCTVNRLEKQ